MLEVTDLEVVALSEIAKQHPELAPQIAAAIDYYDRVWPRHDELDDRRLRCCENNDVTVALFQFYRQTSANRR